MTAQGSAYMRFRRALDRGNVTEALSAASELQFVALAEALELTLLLAEREPEKYERAAARWHVRFVAGGPEHRPPRKPGGARPPRRDPGEPPGRCRPGRAPQPATIVRANRRGACPLVAGGVKLGSVLERPKGDAMPTTGDPLTAINRLRKGRRSNSTGRRRTGRSGNCGRSGTPRQRNSKETQEA